MQGHLRGRDEIAAGEPDGEKAEGAKKGRIPERGRSRCTDVHPVPDEGGASDHRHQQQPGDIRPAGSDDFSGRSHQREQPASAEAIQQEEAKGDGAAPEETAADGGTQPVGGTLSDESTGQRLRCVGESVREIAEKHEQLHEDRADRKDHVAEAGADYRKTDIDRHHSKGTQEQVPVQRKEAAALHRLPFAPGKNRPVTASEGDQAIEEAAPLGDDGADGDARKAQAVEHARQAQGQQDRSGDIHPVDQQVRRHGTHRILHPDEPSFQRKEGQRRRRGPYPDVEVAGRQDPDFFRTGDNEESQPNNERLDGDQSQPGEHGDPQRPRENAPDALPAPPEGLCRQPTRAGAEKGEVPVEQVEEHRPDGNTPNQRR